MAAMPQTTASNMGALKTRARPGGPVRLAKKQLEAAAALHSVFCDGSNPKEGGAMCWGSALNARLDDLAPSSNLDVSQLTSIG